MRLIGKTKMLLMVGLLAAQPLSAQDSDTLPLPRDPEIAIHEEFDMALRSNTQQAWQLFIRRHKDHLLAREATRRLNQLEK
ncbi:hypothetical protein QO002_002667 [Pararhizobium capsulatum DSM 1112]|uniref:Uncharacterized protein n=1 Tax=Pararhizobium capsulatum DSM 1112 TaxID=1121113 RepID=A0ABU0BS48_9HYPH|nr:hypothetical protein [Pararhizobium capsulatum]MDQ0320529.1 hypothetical protein [Pararhizobium capsulatum DSM 1112]